MSVSLGILNYRTYDQLSPSELVVQAAILELEAKLSARPYANIDACRRYTGHFLSPLVGPDAGDTLLVVLHISGDPYLATIKRGDEGEVILDVARMVNADDLKWPFEMAFSRPWTTQTLKED